MIYSIEILIFYLADYQDTHIVRRLIMAAIQETQYRNVRVRRMEEDGGSSLVYPNNVLVSTVYDPKGMMVVIREESEMKEWVVSTNSEFARVGRKGIIFKLSTETLLLTFASDEVLVTFISIQNV